MGTRTVLVGLLRLIEEGKDLIDEIDKGDVLDVALIGAAQKVEHYEIASYTTSITLTTKLGYTNAVPLRYRTAHAKSGRRRF